MNQDKNPAGDVPKASGWESVAGWFIGHSIASTTTQKAVNRLIFITGLLLVLPISAPSADDVNAMSVPDRTLVRIHEVAPGVHAVLAPPALRFADANSTVIQTGREVIVVDVPGRPDRAIALLDWIETLTDKPVRYLILTHWHGDHTQLAGLLVQRFPDLEIIAHPTLVEDLPGRTAPALAEEADGLATALEEAEQRYRSGLNEEGEPLAPEASEELAAAIGRARERLRVLGETGIVRPTLLVPDELVLERGEREIRILHLPGHTEGDLVVFLPQEKVVITADLLDAIPFAGHGDLTRWIASLDALEQLEFETVIPGHGEPLHGKEHLRVVRDFLRSIRDQVNRLATEGFALEEIRERVDVERFRTPLAGEEDLPNRAFGHFRDAAIERAWELLRPISARDANAHPGNEQEVSAADAPRGEQCSAPGFRQFDFWIGEWDVKQKILRQDSAWLTFEAHTSVAAALHGCALVEHWKGDAQFFWEGMETPEPMKGLSVRSYDPKTGQWSIYWMDTRMPAFGSPYVGRFEDGRGTFFRAWETPQGPRIGQITFSDITPESVTWELAVSSDEGQTWSPLWIMEMRRVDEP